MLSIKTNCRIIRLFTARESRINNNSTGKIRFFQNPISSLKIGKFEILKHLSLKDSILSIDRILLIECISVLFQHFLLHSRKVSFISLPRSDNLVPIVIYRLNDNFLSLVSSVFFFSFKVSSEIVRIPSGHN